MLSIMTTYTLTNQETASFDQGKLAEIAQFYSMLVDIISKCTKDIYVGLHSIHCLAAMTKVFPNIIASQQQLKEQLVNCVLKSLDASLGQQDSSCLFLGHLILSLQKNQILH